MENLKPCPKCGSENGHAVFSRRHLSSIAINIGYTDYGVLKYQMCISSMPAAGCTEKMRKEFWKINRWEITEAINWNRLHEWCETRRENLSQCLVDVINTLCAKEPENDG